MEATLSANTNHTITEIHPDKSLINFELKKLWRYRELLYFMVWRDLKIRYKQAAIGAGWAIIQPVFTVAIFTAVFGYFAKIPSDGVPYPAFAFTAMVPWTYFSEALRRSSTGLVEDTELIRKIYFPRLIIPLSAITSPLVDCFLSFIVLIILLTIYGITLNWNIIFLPIFMLISMITALSVGLWLGPVNVRFRDVKHTMPFLIQVWMYATPIVYPLSIVPERWRIIFSLNPMVGVIEGFRWALLGKGPPDTISICISTAITILLLFSGIIYFKRMERIFADII